MDKLELILASSNEHKAEEFKKLLDTEIFSIKSAPEKIEVVEDGSTFTENALKKASAYFDKYKKPVLSDDSGLVVEALPDELGIYSARFGGEGLSDRERAKLLLDKLKDENERKAHFFCVLCFYLSPGEVFFFEGKVNGKISKSYIGEHGFGYDPVFCPDKMPDKTLAEIPEWKEENSHRSKASKFANNFFKSHLSR